MLIDAGCELDGYASDITRTFPANGRFTPAQRELYDIVLAAQPAAVDATRAGRELQRRPRGRACGCWRRACWTRASLDKNKFGTLDDVIAKRAYLPFYMHRTGHWLGMDVHDAGDYRDADGPLDDKARGHGARCRPGMVLTVEPGIYVRPADGVPGAATGTSASASRTTRSSRAAGCELITRDVPVDRRRNRSADAARPGCNRAMSEATAYRLRYRDRRRRAGRARARRLAGAAQRDVAARQSR